MKSGSYHSPAKFAVFLSILIIFSIPTESFALDVKKVFERARPSVVLIIAHDSRGQPMGIGSGFFIGDGKTIATNYHVVSQAAALSIKASDGQVGNALSVLGIDEKNDLALLEVNITGLSMKLGTSQPDIGEDILAIGNPNGLEGTVSTGIISGVRSENGSQYFQITAPISPGSSGGPIIDENENVVGVASFYLDGAQSLNFAMPAAYVQKLYNNKTPEPLTVLTNRAPKKPKKIESNIKVLFAEGEFSGRLGASYLNATIVNQSGQSVKNVKVVVNYFKNSNQDIPIHYSLHEFKEIVPANLSLRVRRLVNNMEAHWTPIITVLDYEIISKTDAGSLLKFD